MGEGWGRTAYNTFVVVVAVGSIIATIYDAYQIIHGETKRSGKDHIEYLRRRQS